MSAEPPVGPPGESEPDPVEELAERMLEDLEQDLPEPGSLPWIRSTLRGEGHQDPLVGSLFQGKYRLLRQVGRGGFGAVYEAIDERGAGNRVALKIQLPGIGHAAERLASFRAEALRVIRLAHPNVVDWKSFDETPDGGSFFVMELVDGRPLSELIAHEAPLEWRRAARLLAQVLSALRAAHAVAPGESILHLDLKPRNILVIPAGDGRPETAKVIDFGIGQHLGSPDPEEAPLPPGAAGHGDDGDPGTLTTSAAPNRDLAGYPFPIARAYTAEYASPEQCVHVRFADGEDLEPRPLDGRADLYSLGVIAYELLTGRLPYARPALRAGWLQVHLEAPLLPWTPEEEARVPRGLRRLVERLLARDPADRPADAAAALGELERLLAPPLTRRLALAAVLLVVLGALLARTLLPGEGRLELTDDGGRAAARLWSEVGAPPPELRLAGDAPPSGPLLLLDTDGEVLTGWRVEREGPRALRLVAPDPDPEARGGPPRRAHPGLRIATADRRRVSDPFELVRLGEGARDATLSLGEQPLGADGPPGPVDPEGLVLAVRLEGLELSDLDVAASRLRIGEEELPLVSRAEPGGGSLLGAVLPALPDGRQEATLLVPLLGGEPWGTRFPLEVIASPLAPEARWIDDRGRELAWGAGGVHADAPARVRLVASRPATVRGSVPDLAALALAPTGASAASAELELPTAWLGASPPPTALFLEFLDGVLHGPASEARHRVRLELPLRVLPRRPFTPGLLVPGSPGSTLGGVTHHDGRRPLLLVGLEDADPAREELELEGPEGARLPAPGAANGVEADLAPRLAQLGLGPEGLHRLTVRRWALGPDGLRIGPLPTGEAELLLRTDRSPPALEISATPLLLEPLGTPPVLRARVLGPAGSPVEVACRLLRGEGGEEVGVGRRAPDPGDGTVTFSLTEFDREQRLEDGFLVAELRARDLAGNEAPPVRVPVEVARTGPRLTALSPPEELQAATSSWELQGGELLPIVAVARDANGVAGVSCRARRTSEPGPGLDLGPGSRGPEEDRWTWSLEPPPSWSLAEDIELLLRATDSRGRVSILRHGPFRLPRVRPRLPDRLGDLLLVPGNEDGPYTFHGRGDPAVENAGLLAAGLRPFWVPRGAERPGETESPWAIPVPAGSLAPVYLAENEVTSAEYLEFLEAGDGYGLVDHWSGPPPRAQRRAELRSLLERRPPDSVATGVWHAEAEAYARWRGRRLPTLLELEFAIRAGSRWRTLSWDADGSDSHDAEDPFHRLRGLSRGAEWTSSPARTDGAGGFVLPRDLEDFQPGCAPGEHYWISGTAAGHVLQPRDRIRRDFAAIDVGEARGWANSRVGFRLAASPDEALTPPDPDGGGER